MITEEQSREWKATAERYRAWIDNAMPWPARQRYERQGRLLLDRHILADAYLALLDEDEAERAERAKPIDAEWLESIGFRLPHCREEPGLWFGDVVRYNTAFVECVVCNARPNITTRGQLLDLLAALKGGA